MKVILGNFKNGIRILIVVLVISLGYSQGKADPLGGVPGELMHELGFSPMQMSVLNPAYLYKIDKEEINFVDKLLFGGINILGVSYARPYRLAGTISSSLIWSNAGNIEATDKFGNAVGRFYDGEGIFNLSYAHKLNEEFYIGVNLKSVIRRTGTIVDNSIARIGSMGEALDLGMVFQPVTGLHLGMAMDNLVFLKVTGTNQTYDRWPSNLYLNFDYQLLDDRLNVGIKANILDVVTDKSDFIKTKNLTSMALNYKMIYFVRPWFSFLGSVNEHTFNVGVSYKATNLLKFNEDLDIRLVSGYNYKFEGFTTSFELGTQWGYPRDQQESIRILNNNKLEPHNAYDEALKLYHKKHYWAASYVFGKVTSLYPNMDRIEEAHYYTAESFMKLGLYIAAEKVYVKLLMDYPTFKLNDEVSLKLQKIYYRMNKYNMVMEFYAKIISKYPISKILGDAHYLAGQVAFKNGEFAKSLEYFKKVNESSSSYRYAQYSMGIAHLQLSNTKKAIINLKKVFEMAAKYPLDRIIIDRARITLGYIYNEQFDYKNSINQYKKVKKKSRYRPDAVFALAWSLAILSKFDEALAIIKDFWDYPDHKYYNEVLLLKGYCQTLTKDYKKAVKTFEAVMNNCRQLVRAEGSDLDIDVLVAAREEEVADLRLQVNATEQSIFEGIYQKPSKMQKLKSKEYNDLFHDQRITYYEVLDGFTDLKTNYSKIQVNKNLLQKAEYAHSTTIDLIKIEKKKSQDANYKKKIEDKMGKILESLKEKDKQKVK